MVNMNMMGQMPGVQDTSEMALQQAQAQLQAQFSPGALQAAQGIYGTSPQKDMSLIQREHQQQCFKTKDMDYKKQMVSNPTGGAKGEIGESALWDGPLSQEGRPHGKGSSSGATGMQVLKYPTPYKYKPITQCAKGRSNESY